MNKKTALLLLILSMIFTGVTGCESKEDDKKITLSDNEYMLYYVSIDSTRLVQKALYFDKDEELEKQVQSMLEHLTEDSSDNEYKSVLPERVVLQDYSIQENGLITLDLSGSYYEAEASTQVLCKAAFVKSLTQIAGISMVDFTVDSQPMMNKEVLEGALISDVFIDSDNGKDSNQVQDVTIYFANVTKDLLEPIRIPINASGNVSAEQLVMERLIAGTDERGYYNTIPSGTKLLSVSTKDGVCYVDLSSEFLKVPKGMKDQTVIYSVVNSLCELATVNKVSFTIEGKQIERYNGNIPFNQLFERNLDLVDNE